MGFGGRFLVKVTGLLAVLGLVGMAACSHATPVNPTQTGGAGNGTITFAIDESQRSRYQNLADDFHRENPSITVRIVTPPGGFDLWNAEDLAPLAAAADATLFMGGRQRLLDNGGDFLDLSALMDGDTAFDPADFWPGSLAACQDGQGHTLGVPLALTFMGLFYDAGALQNAGITPPAVGWTLDDLQAMVQALAATQTGPILLDANAWQSSLLAPAVDASLASAGGKIDAPGIIQTAQGYVDWARQDNLIPFTATGAERMPNSHPVFWVGALNAGLPDGSDRPALGSYQVAHFPLVAGDGQAAGSTPVWPDCALVSAGTSHPREAWAWIAYLSRQWPDAGWPAGSTPPSIPARQSVATAQYPWNDLPQEAQAAVRYGLAHAWYGSAEPQVFAAVGDAIAASITTGSTSLEVALAQAMVSPSPTPRTAPVVVASPEPQGSAQTGVQVVRYLYPNFANSDQVYRELAAEFQKAHPDVAIQLMSDFTFRGDPLPSLVQDYDCFSFGELAQDSDITRLADLSPFFDQEGSSFSADFYPGLLESLTVDGHLYGLPAGNGVYLVHVNLDLLNQLGLAMPSVDWTVDDLIRFIQQAPVERSGETTYASAGMESYLLAARGARWVDYSQEPAPVTVDSPASVQAVRWLMDLIDSRAAFPLSQNYYDDMNRAISAGQVLLWISSSLAPSSYSFPVAVLPLPQIAAQDVFTTGRTGASANFISPDSPVKAACWDWIRYLSDQAEAAAGVPSRPSVVRSAEYTAQVGQDTARAVDVAQSNSQLAYIPFTHVPVTRWTWQALMRVYQGEDAQAVLSEVQYTVESYTQCLAGKGLLSLGLYVVVGDDPRIDAIDGCAKQADPGYVSPGFP